MIASLAIDLLIGVEQEPLALDAEGLDAITVALRQTPTNDDLRTECSGLVQLAEMMRSQAGSPRLAEAIIAAVETALPRLEARSSRRQQRALVAAGIERRPLFAPGPPPKRWRAGDPPRYARLATRVVDWPIARPRASALTSFDQGARSR